MSVLLFLITSPMQISTDSISTQMLMDAEWLMLSHPAAKLVQHMVAVSGEEGEGDFQASTQIPQPKSVTYYIRSQHTY